MICRLLIICALLIFGGAVCAQTVTSPDVAVKLSLAEKKTVYRIGDPIKLVVDFATDRDGYNVDIIPDGTQPGLDTILLSPETGVTHWVNELADNRVMPRHAFGYQQLTNAPLRVEITLNETLRFDAPGRYLVTVMTRRVSRRSGEQLALSTNPVEFEVQPMTEQEEVKRLSALVDSGRSASTPEIAAAQWLYLTGDPSTREKVRRFLDSQVQRSGPAFQGLFIARNRSLALKLLEAGLQDPSIPVTSDLIFLVTRLKTLLMHGVREKPTEVNWYLEAPEHPRAAEIRTAYIMDLAAGLSRRTGKNQTTTALTILEGLPKDTPTTNPALRDVRNIVVQQFDSLSSFSQERLLREHWELLRDPALIPSLKKMAGSTSNSSRPAAIQRLLELAPDEARSYVLAEIRDPDSFVDPILLGGLSEKTLPEVEAALVDQIRNFSALSNNRDRVRLKVKTALLVRYATENVYQDVMDLYLEVGAKLPNDARAGLLAYLSKHNEEEAIRLVEQALAEVKPGTSPLLLSDIARLHYFESLGTLLKKLLETDDPMKASHAAYVIGLHGPAGGREVLEARLKRWREQWRDRVAEADAQLQGKIERELIFALINARSWNLSPERVKELKMSCLTEFCKQTHRVQ